jgi:multidrug efflux pump subunit AcrB
MQSIGVKTEYKLTTDEEKENKENVKQRQIKQRLGTQHETQKPAMFTPSQVFLVDIYVTADDIFVQYKEIFQTLRVKGNTSNAVFP